MRKIARRDGKTVDNGSVEGRCIHGRSDVFREDAPEHPIERDLLDTERGRLQRLAKRRDRIIARKDIQELVLGDSAALLPRCHDECS